MPLYSIVCCFFIRLFFVFMLQFAMSKKLMGGGTAGWVRSPQRTKVFFLEDGGVVIQKANSLKYFVRQNFLTTIKHLAMHACKKYYKYCKHA